MAEHFYFRENIISRLPNPVELSHEWVLTNFNHQESAFYEILFYESKEGTFEVQSGRPKSAVIIKPGPGAPKFFLQYSTSGFVFCLLSSIFLFVGKKFAADYFKYNIIQVRLIKSTGLNLIFAWH